MKHCWSESGEGGCYCLLRKGHIGGHSWQGYLCNCGDRKMFDESECLRCQYVRTEKAERKAEALRTVEK